MKRHYMILAAVIILIVAINIVLYPKIKENQIRKEIEKANYCNVDSDCVDAGQKCPFGCYNYVNKNEADRIGTLLEEYDTKCVYDCILCESAQCIDNRCVEACE